MSPKAHLVNLTDTDYRENVLFLAGSQSWKGLSAQGGPWWPPDVWTASSWQAWAHFQIWFLFQWHEGDEGDEWTLLHGQSSWLRAPVSCFPGWITPLLLVLCSEHSYACTSVSKNIECWSLLETSTALCFVFSVVTHPQHSKPFLPWVLWGLQDLHAIPIESGLCSWLDRLRETGWPQLPILWQALELPGMHS